jgi:hypothetical protein
MNLRVVIATERAMLEMLFTYWPLFLFQDILLPIYVLHFLKIRTAIDSINFQSASVIQRVLFLYFIKFTITI